MEPVLIFTRTCAVVGTSAVSPVVVAGIAENALMEFAWRALANLRTMKS